jgi:hypothetical protein
LIGIGRLSGNETSTLWSPNKSGTWSQPTGREHELSRAGTTLRPELSRSGLLSSMKGKFFRKIGRDRYGNQCKKSAYMGKEEVWERNWLI